MTKTITTPAKPWVRPAVQKIAAGDAEVGQRPSTGDGAFTQS